MGELTHYFRRLNNSEKQILYSQSVSTIGDFMALPAFLNIALERGEHIVSLFLIIYFLPRALQPFLGYIVDKFHEKSVALTSEILRCGLFVVLFIYPMEYPTVLWLAIAGINSALGSIFDPARLKLMTAVATDFSKYNAIFNFFYSFTGIISIGISILLVSFFRTEVIFLLNAVTFLISYLMLNYVNVERRDVASFEVAFSLKQLIEGFLFLKYKTLAALIVILIFIDFFTGVLYEMLPTKSISIGMSQYGTYIYSAFICLGNSIGAYFIFFVSRRLSLLTPIIMLFTFVTVSFIYFDWAIISFVAFTIFFVIQMIAIGVSEGVIKENVPREYQGRVFALSDSFPLMALTVGSWISNQTSINMLCILVAIMLCATLVVLRRLNMLEREISTG